VALNRELPEHRPARAHVATEDQEPEELTRFSSLNRLIRVTAWIRRWLARLSTRSDSIRETVLSAAELTDSRVTWIRRVQGIAFRGEIEALREGCPGLSWTASGAEPVQGRSRTAARGRTSEARGAKPGSAASGDITSQLSFHAPGGRG
jgi:hypothetical protein